MESVESLFPRLSTVPMGTLRPWKPGLKMVAKLSSAKLAFISVSLAGSNAKCRVLGAARITAGTRSETWGSEPQSLSEPGPGSSQQDRTRSPSPTPASRTQWDPESLRAEISL